MRLYNNFEGKNMKMKRNIFWLGMLVIILTLGMTVVSCDDGGDDNNNNNGNSNGNGNGGGTLTITDIPAKYNGKYAYFMLPDNSRLSLLGLQSFNVQTQTMTLVQITNGTVTLPMWKATVSGSNITAVTRYSGNDTSTYPNKGVQIYDIQTLNEESSGTRINAISYGSKSITFSNGSATLSCNDGTLNPTDN
jgi:hypothetical protein